MTNHLSLFWRVKRIMRSPKLAHLTIFQNLWSWILRRGFTPWRATWERRTIDWKPQLTKHIPLFLKRQRITRSPKLAHLTILRRGVLASNPTDKSVNSLECNSSPERPTRKTRVSAWKCPHTKVSTWKCLHPKDKVSTWKCPHPKDIPEISDFHPKDKSVHLKVFSPERKEGQQFRVPPERRTQNLRLPPERQKCPLESVLTRKTRVSTVSSATRKTKVSTWKCPHSKDPPEISDCHPKDKSVNLIRVPLESIL